MAKTENNQAGLYDKSHQIDLIADSLIDTANLYHHENVSVNPFLDNLHLLVQEPRCISFLKSAGRKLRPVYSSLRDPDLQPAFRNYLDRQSAISEARTSSIQIPGTDYYLCAHRIILEGENALLHPQFQSVTPDDFKRVFERLATTNTELGQNVIDCLEACLPSLQLDPPSPPEVDWATESKERRETLEHFDINGFWRRLRAEIDLALGLASHSRLLKNDSELQNLFCVVRTATNLRPRRGSLNYTARVLLTTAQSNRVQKIADPSLLEEPLGDESRSIADSVFHSGLIDFSDETTGEGRDLWSRDRRFRDYLRHEAEKKVYPTLSRPHRPHTFYVPIHVSGVAWLGLFTISPKPDNPTAAKWWSHNYGIYRALIPTVAGKLRAGAKRLFLAYISEIFGEHLSKPDVASFVRSVNTAWKCLCYVMPFPAIELMTEAADGAVALALPHGRKVWLKMHDENPHFQQQVKHELLTQGEVLTVCEEAAKLAELERHRTVSQTQEVMSYTVAHDARSTLRNGVILPLTDCLKAGHDANGLRTEIRKAISRVEAYCDDVSFWLGGIADFYAPGGISDFQVLDSSKLRSVLSADSLALKDIGQLPTIETALLGVTSATLHISERSFNALVHLLVENAVDAIQEKKGHVIGETIKVRRFIWRISKRRASQSSLPSFALATQTASPLARTPVSE